MTTTIMLEGGSADFASRDEAIAAWVSEFEEIANAEEIPDRGIWERSFRLNGDDIRDIRVIIYPDRSPRQTLQAIVAKMEQPIQHELSVSFANRAGVPRLNQILH